MYQMLKQKPYGAGSFSALNLKKHITKYGAVEEVVPRLVHFGLYMSFYQLHC